MGLLPCQPGGERGEGFGLPSVAAAPSSNIPTAGLLDERRPGRGPVDSCCESAIHHFTLSPHPLCLLGMECCSYPTHGDAVGGMGQGGSHCGVRIDTNSSARAMDYRFIGLLVSISVVNRQSIVLQFSMTRVEKHFSRTRDFRDSTRSSLVNIHSIQYTCAQPHHLQMGRANKQDNLLP